jgi:AbrB family looped-hinge helix DNA binding protein
MWAENGIGYGMTATLDKAGRIVLPKKLREKLHLKPGAKLTIEFVGDKIEIENKGKRAPRCRTVFVDRQMMRERIGSLGV